MKLQNLAIGLVLALASGLGPHAHAQSEVMVGWQTSASAPSERTLVWSDAPTLPAAATADLNELRAALVAIGQPKPAVMVSKNGRSVAATGAKNGADSAPPAGVTVWLDWQIADATIHFADVSQVQYLSNNHVLLSQHPEGGPYVSFVVDLRRPTTRFQFTGYQLDTLRVTDAGKWAALATDGSLSSGQLNPAGTEGTVTGAAVPVSGIVRNLVWRQDGRFLLVEKEDGGLDSLRTSDWSVASSITGGLGPHKGSARPIGRDACFGYQPTSGACVFTVSSAGVISAAGWPTQLAGETSVYVSPLRKFLITQKKDANEFVTSYCRKTPYASESDVIPSWPVVPQGTKIQEIGWLLWLP